VSLPASLKCIPTGGNDLSQDRLGGPSYQPKPAIKIVVKISSRNYDLKRITPKDSDLSKDRPGGPSYQPKPAIKNVAEALLLFLIVLELSYGYQVDARPIEKHNALIKCDLPKFNLKQKWNGSYGKEYEYLTSQASQLQERN